MQPETEPQAVEHTADCQFRPSVLWSDTRHIGAALGRCKAIHLNCLARADANSTESYPRHIRLTRRPSAAITAH